MKSETFNPNELAKQLGLTNQQQKFCDYYTYVCGLDGEKAVEMAEYKFGNYDNYSPELKEMYLSIQRKRAVRELLDNVDILRYIKALRDNMDGQLIIDKLWVIQKLKKLAETGTERTQLEATKMLGQNLHMFGAEVEVNIADDPSQIMKKAFEKRKEEERIAKNTVEFKAKTG
jgi:phage terminase small subunit